MQRVSLPALDPAQGSGLQAPSPGAAPRPAGSRAQRRPRTHDAAGEADAPQAGTHVVPHADAATADPLAHGQLQEEEWDPDDDQQHEVGHQVGTWGRGRSVRACLEHGPRVREDSHVLQSGPHL